MGAWFGLWPLAAQADYLSNAREALKKGDLKSAQIDLRNAVRTDPQNAEAHYWLGRVTIELGDPVAGEREASAAWERGFDPNQAVPLLAQAMMAQNKYAVLLEKLKPLGKDGGYDAMVLVHRGYAQLALGSTDDAQKSFSDAELAAPNAVEPLLADARLALARRNMEAAREKIDRALSVQPKSPDALLAKANLLKTQNDLTGALAVLDGLITDQPSITQARLDRASVALAMGKNDLAKGDIDLVLKATRGNIQAIYLLAAYKAQTKDFKGADEQLQHIEAQLGRVPRGHYLKAIVKEQLGLLAEADEAARKYLARAPNDLAAYKVLARIQVQERRPDQVIETLAKVAESGKGDAQTYDLLGRAYASTGRGAESIKAFQQAEALAPDDVGLQTRLASVRMGQGDIDAAVGDLEHTLELAPKLPAVAEALFFAALASGNTEKAADALTRIRTAQGETETVGNLEGLFKLSQLDVPGAAKLFGELSKKYPDFMPVKVNLARALALQGQNDQAQELLATVLKKTPAAEPALSMLAASYVEGGRMGQAVTLLEAANKSPDKTIRTTVSLGDLYIRSGAAQKALDLIGADKAAVVLPVEMVSLRAAAQLALGQKKEARDTYSELLKKDPNIVGARRQLIALLLEAGDYETARGVINSGIAASPRNYQLYQDLAMVDMRATGVDAALATAERVLSQDRQFIGAYALKGDVYVAANRPLDAITAYQAALKEAPSAMLVSRLATIQLRSGALPDALQTLTDWLAKHPDDLTITAQVAEIHIGTNKLPEAAVYLEKILKTKPHDAVALNNLAWILQQQGNPRAGDLARQAYILSPGAQTADTLGWILTTGGQAATGLPLLRQAVAQGGSDPRIKFHFAVALKDTGDKEQAMKTFVQVVEAKGDFKEKVEAQRFLEEMKKGL